MNSHYLDHIVVESTDSLHFILLDASTYNPDLTTPITYYDVFLPNFSTAVSLQYAPTEQLVVNSTVLGQTSFTNFNTLVDGLWIIKQKVVNPTDITETFCYHTRNYLRIINTKNRILEKIQTALDDCDCKAVDKYYKWLQDLELAKMMAENLCLTSRALVLFNAISSEINNCPNCL